MNVVDLILVAILACVTLHFYFRKKKKALSSGKEKEKPIRWKIHSYLPPSVHFKVIP